MVTASIYFVEVLPHLLQVPLHMSDHSFGTPRSSFGSTRERSITDPGTVSLQTQRRLYDQPHISEDRQQWWSPFSLSSPSLSTEYGSTAVSPRDAYQPLFPQGFDYLRPEIPRSFAPDTGLGLLTLETWPYDEPNDSPWSPSWSEKIPWSEPCLLQHPRQQFEPTDDVATELEETGDYSSAQETPSEPPKTLSQDEVDRNTKEMTCGAELEEHFWPVRYQIRHGRLHVRVWCSAFFNTTKSDHSRPMRMQSACLLSMHASNPSGPRFLN
ncbi:hypothetical protein C8J57DRAFT_1366526 [Mycena rebaudengoi]|nr:hypothetical protein C8J57DRAFT_1366526 [Mycena rebaudengoi]